MGGCADAGIGAVHRDHRATSMTDRTRQIQLTVGGLMPDDRPSLAALYRAHWSELCRYIATRFGAGPPEPQDVVQAAFTKYAMLDDPQAVGNPRAFLHRTAHNVAVDAYRRKERFGHIAKDIDTLARGAVDVSPEDVISSREEIGRLNAVLAQLPENQRTALLLHRLDGLSFADIAREMNISPSGARFLVSKGLDACMAALTTEDEA